MAKTPAQWGETLPAGYPAFLSDVKARVQAARTRAVLSANRSLIELYWGIGREILVRERREGWGSRVIDRLAADLRREFPDMTGFSRSNLKYMRAFAEAWPQEGGFALVGRQFHLGVLDEETGEEADFYLDLLFYNYILRRFVVIDLKIEDFKPEFAGKMNFYLNAVDELQRQPGDAPAIGLILCPGRSRTVTEWALRGIGAPVAVARYVTGEMELTQDAPASLKPALPDLPDLAHELTGIVEAAVIVYNGEEPVATG